MTARRCRIRTRRANVGDIVEIQWVRPNGTVYTERHTAPPLLVQEARTAERLDDRHAALRVPGAALSKGDDHE